MTTVWKNICISIALALLFPMSVFAQVEQIFHATIVEVISETPVNDTITGEYVVQELKARLEDSDKKGEIVSLTNDFAQFKKGDKVFLRAASESADATSYSIVERDRRPVLLGFVILFVMVIIWFGKKQGLRSLLSLAGSMLVLAYVLMPALLRGIHPMLVSTVIAAIILCIAIYFTHGFKRESTVALLGTVAAVVVTGLLSILAVKLLHFTGLGTEDAWYLKQRIDLDFRGLLLGGIMIGVLGVLDDIAVTQVSVVRELYSSAAHLSKSQIYTKALRVGQEHVGALVNTLALAYTGASLPLLLLFSQPTLYPASVIVSQEMFSVEIIRTIVGSIGLILTVPITTALAVHMLEHYRGKPHDHQHQGHAHTHIH